MIGATGLLQLPPAAVAAWPSMGDTAPAGRRASGAQGAGQEDNGRMSQIPDQDATERIAAHADGIARAAELLRAGDLVAFPTETVYGLGGDAMSETATAAIFAAKRRPPINPLIVHVISAEDAERLAFVSRVARRVAEAHWPGPLTLVLPRREGSGLAQQIAAGLPTVAIRVPAHPLAATLLAETGRPLAAPSANPSGAVSPTMADHVLEGLAGRITAVIDGGPCPVGLESTILGFDGERPVLLRPGGLTAEALAETLAQMPEPPRDHRIRAPGQLASHYAPVAHLRLDATVPEPGEAWLGLGPIPAGTSGPALSLSETGDLAEAAARLFGALRALDKSLAGAGTIAVGPIPQAGLGIAINDRLARAAAPRAR